MASVANTSVGPYNALRKAVKSEDLLTNSRSRFIRPASSQLIDHEQTIVGETRLACVQDYSPCECYNGGYFDAEILYVSCYKVSVEIVRDVFQRVNDPEIYYLDFYPLADATTNTISITADLLGNTSMTSGIYIRCYDTKYPNLVIDPLAFRASQNSLVSFQVDNFDLALQKDFSFLGGFNKLESLYISNVNNLTAFQYLPPLPSLQTLTLGGCPELNQIPFPDLSPAKLKHLQLYNSDISDQEADEIVASLAESNSADSLEGLYFDGNSLTRIPSQVGSAFPQLKIFNLGWNNISHIPSSSLTFAYPLEALVLFSNRLKTIKSGAFRGINRLLNMD